MRRNYRNLFMVGVMAFATCLTSCKKDEGPTLDITVNGSEELAEEIRSTSASFTLKTSDVDSVAYYVELGAASESDYDATVLYATAREEGRVVPVVDGENTITVYSLEGNTEYTVFFVYAKDGKFVMKSKVFTTPAYDRIITVVESKKDGFKFHFNVPDTMHYMYAFLPAEQYHAFRNNWGHNDLGFLSDGRKLKGPQTVTINSGEDWIDEGDGGFFIHPGSSYMLLMGECDAEGNLYAEINEDYVNDDPWGGGWGPLAPATREGSSTAPRMGDYTEEPWYTDDMYPSKTYARQHLLAALTMVDSKVKVELTGKTERRIKIRCSAEDGVEYVVAPMMEAQYEDFVNLVTEVAVPSTLLEYYGYDRYSGTQDFELDENSISIAVDSTYVISVVGIYDEDASIISYDTLQVTLTKSTKPAAEVTVTGLEPTDANFVWFNVKSEKQNVYAAKHIANYTKEVKKMLNEGYTYEMLLEYYGEYLSEEDVKAINSAEGLNLSIYSMEDSETTLLIGAFNEEEGMTAYAGVGRSAEKPALDPVDSPLFEDLKGEWTARFIHQVSEYSYETFDYTYYTDTTYTTLTLGESFDNSPATFDASHEYYANVYNSHYNIAIENGATEAEADEYAQKMVAEQFAEYKAMVTKYENKYKGQNYILGLGLNEAHTFATPWDLFCATNYTAADVEELFYAYGPKLFFQVQQDGSLQLLCDATMTSLTPAAAWGSSEYVVVGYNPTNSDNPYNGNFPVEISEDKNTLVIKGVDNGGEMCYPAIAYWEYGVWLAFRYSTIEDVVLTRGAVADEEVEEPATRVAKVAFERPTTGSRIKRTYLPEVAMPKAKTVEMNYVPVLEKLQEKFNKYNERMSK
ncbi:MAG: hypothetical protein IJE15_08105 [Bacteroidaceae bacterium]|nr:hypothetical protein [Bacteroidaceae bacterium]